MFYRLIPESTEPTKIECILDVHRDIWGKSKTSDEIINDLKRCIEDEE